MTLFGKLLVFVNLVLSVILVAIAVGLYTQRIDWSGSGSGPTANKGEVAKLKDKLKPANGWGLYDDLSASEARFEAAAPALAAVRNVRTRNQEWYAAQLKTLDTSDRPVMDLVDESGKLVLDPSGLPKLQKAQDRAGAEMLGEAQYRDQMKVLTGKIQDDQAEFKKVKAEDIELSDQIVKPGGLRELRELEKHKVRQIEEELETLKPLWYNTLVEKELVVNRKDLLEARKTQLEKAKGLANRR